MMPMAVYSLGATLILPWLVHSQPGTPVGGKHFRFRLRAAGRGSRPSLSSLLADGGTVGQRVGERWRTCKRLYPTDTALYSSPMIGTGSL